MTRLHQVLMRELLAEIAMGEPAPGEMLPRELDLAKRFGVSRGVIRECIRGLEERGMISVKHGRGQTVNSPDRWDVLDPEVVSAMLEAPDGDRLVSDVLACQLLLEVQAAGLAAERGRREDVDALTGAIELMAAVAPKADRTSSAADRYRSADLEFHRVVMHASGNRALARMSEPLHQALAAVPDRLKPIRADRHLADHRQIVDAIAGRDAAAARAAMTAHLERQARGARRSARRR